MCPARIAALSAARRLALMRVSVLMLIGRLATWCWRTIAVGIACTCAAERSASRV